MPADINSLYFGRGMYVVSLHAVPNKSKSMDRAYIGFGFYFRSTFLNLTKIIENISISHIKELNFRNIYQIYLIHLGLLLKSSWDP